MEKNNSHPMSQNIYIYIKYKKIDVLAYGIKWENVSMWENVLMF